jgi:glycosyltransferase involved in cell wall biosynthesis
MPKNRFFRKIQALFNTLTWYHTFRDTLSILKIIDKTNIEVIWFGYGNISYQLIYAIRMARPNIKIVCDTDSVWSRFILRELPFTKNIFRRALLRLKANRKEWEEKAMTQLCNITTAVSEIDAGYYQSISQGNNQIYLFPNVIDLKDYSLNSVTLFNLKKPCMFLSGTFGNKYSSMNIAANWVLDKVLPLVQSQIPDIHLYIVGKNADISLRDAASDYVTIIGKIPSVLPFLCHANVSLVPLMFESGTRFKILEAAVCRVPIVSTTLGAEGLPVIHGSNLNLFYLKS